jgi:hypothetical protein
MHSPVMAISMRGPTATLLDSGHTSPFSHTHSFFFPIFFATLQALLAISGWGNTAALLDSSDSSSFSQLSHEFEEVGGGGGYLEGGGGHAAQALEGARGGGVLKRIKGHETKLDVNERLLKEIEARDFVVGVCVGRCGFLHRPHALVA